MPTNGYKPAHHREGTDELASTRPYRRSTVQANPSYISLENGSDCDDRTRERSVDDQAFRKARHEAPSPNLLSCQEASRGSMGAVDGHQHALNQLCSTQIVPLTPPLTRRMHVGMDVASVRARPLCALQSRSALARRCEQV